MIVGGHPERWYSLLRDLEEAATAQTMPRFLRALQVEDKGGRDLDPVTEADRAAELAMRDLLARRVPDHGIVGEELGVTPGDGPYTWILDPIDGTRAFISGFPTWVTLIGLVEDGEPVLGSIVAPATRTVWRGSVGSARADREVGGEGSPIRTRPCRRWADAIVSTTSPELFEGPAAHAWSQIVQRSRLRRYGGDGYAYGNLASGLIDLVVENHLQPYDIAAVVAVVRAAGGVATAWDGGPPLGGSGTLVAAGDPHLHALALELLAESGAA